MSTGARTPLFAVPPQAPAEPPNPVWPLWVVYVAGVISGVVILVGSVGASAGQTPRLAAVSVVLFGAFGIGCAWLLNKIPYFCPVRRETLGLAVLWGAVVAIGYALLANLAIYKRFAAAGDAQGWALFAPFTEEPLKVLGIVVVMLLAAVRPRTALDGLVVGSFVGLGFEVVENVVQSINNAIATAPAGNPDNWGSLAMDFTHEVLRRSWTGHIVITGIAGFGIGYAMTVHHRSAIQRWSVAVALVLLAFGGHLLWNSHRFGVFYVLGQFGLLGVYLWLIKVGRRQEKEIYLPYLSYVAPSLLETRSADGSSPKPTRRHRRAVARLVGAIANGDGARAHEWAERLAR